MCVNGLATKQHHVTLWSQSCGHPSARPPGTVTKRILNAYGRRTFFFFRPLCFNAHRSTVHHYRHRRLHPISGLKYCQFFWLRGSSSPSQARKLLGTLKYKLQQRRRFVIPRSFEFCVFSLRSHRPQYLLEFTISTRSFLSIVYESLP